MCRLPHSRRKGHCLTPKRCLDWWYNAPFFCGYAKRCFYGFSDDFSFSLSICAGSGKYAECVSLPHEWSKRPHTAGQTGKNDCCRPVEQVPSDRKHSYFFVGGLPFSRFRRCLFFQSVPLFTDFPLKFFLFQSASVFVYLHLAPFSRIASGSHFRLGRKGTSGLYGISKYFWKNLQPFG